jgi:hypothetical protein
MVAAAPGRDHFPASISLAVNFVFPKETTPATFCQETVQFIGRMPKATAVLNRGAGDQVIAHW